MSISSQQLKVYRHEEKYFIGQAEYIYLRNIFNTTLRVDTHGKYQGDYWIRSLYFDTAQNKDYYDKIVGVKDRRKIRLRIYCTDSETVKLEIKNRYNQYMLKETVTISKEDALSLIGGDSDVLLKYNSQIAEKVYFLVHADYYKPSIIVDYEREAYTCPINQIRLTFDKNIRTSNACNNMFDKEISTINIFDEEKIVLEVKYDKMLPKWIRSILSTGIGERSSISKYCLARAALN